MHTSLDSELLLRQLAEHGFAAVTVHSGVADRAEYLRRPDLGRRLDAPSRAKLEQCRAAPPPEVVFVLADGLSARATHAHGIALLVEMRARLPGWNIGTIVVAQQARVALGDDIGAILGAGQVVMLIGERPGLSSPDSLGAYLTYGPRPGRTDAERNCVSNIRGAGLSYAVAAHKICYLLTQARRLRLSGIGLKDDSAALNADEMLPGGAGRP